MDLTPETTQPVKKRYADTFGDQAATLAFLARLATEHPYLPPAYMPVSWIQPTEVGIQLRMPSMIDPWREALGVPADAVTEQPFGAAERQISFKAVVDGFELTVWTTALAATDTDGGAENGDN
ncbi:hypothetical protein ACWEHT_11430 [Streptomyces sp. NPDC004646]